MGSCLFGLFPTIGTLPTVISRAAYSRHQILRAPCAQIPPQSRSALSHPASATQCPPLSAAVCLPVLNQSFSQVARGNKATR